ncbi:MAG TPA: twin-arginine translocase TatA/TatE family subunit [Thermoanaerobaculia bacterium]|jgi:sec-independent protein translocase protein TatA
MAGLGVPELAIIFLIIIVLFGANKIPQIGKGLGEGIRNFKKGMNEGDQPQQIPEKSTTSTTPPNP